VTIRVRPFAERDYPAVARIWRISEGEPVDAEALRARDARWDRSRFQKVRVVAVDEDDAPLGYGEIYHEPSRFEPRRYFMRIGVDPPKRRRGIGAAVWAHLAAELEERRGLVACLWARDHTACVESIAARGFREVIRSYAQVIAVAAAPLPTPASRERLDAAGTRMASLADLAAHHRDAYAKAHALALPDEYLVAVAGDEYVGQCTARRAIRAEDVLQLGVTAVRPAYRRRGIGRALKLTLHEYAREGLPRDPHEHGAREHAAGVARHGPGIRHRGVVRRLRAGAGQLTRYRIASG